MVWFWPNLAGVILWKARRSWLFDFSNWPPGGRVYLVTEIQKWHLKRPYQSKWADSWLSWSWRVYAEFVLPIKKSATRGPSLFSDWNTKIALRAPKSVPIGLIFYWVGPKGYAQSSCSQFWNQPPGDQVYFVTEMQKQHLESANQSKWADIWLSWFLRVYAELISHQRAMFI